MKKKILFFTIVFTLLMLGGNAAGESGFSLEGYYLYGGYFDQGLFPLTRLAPRDPFTNLLIDLDPAISRTRARSLMGTYGRISGHHTRLGFFDHQSQIYLDRGLGPFFGFAPRNSLDNLIFDLRPGISRIKYRSFFASSGTHSYRRFPGRPYRRNFYGHQYRLSFHEYYYRYGYTQSDYNQQLQSNYYKSRLYKGHSTSRPFPYRYQSGVRSYGSGMSFRGRFR